MNTVYLIIPLVFGIVLSYLWLIHHFWLRLNHWSDACQPCCQA